jgi:hypothetical protein
VNFFGGKVEAFSPRSRVQANSFRICTDKTRSPLRVTSSINRIALSCLAGSAGSKA